MTTSNIKEHIITTKFVPAKCQAAGHRDIVAECSCGWKITESHGELRSIGSQILGHRLMVIEEALGIKYERRHVQ